MALASRSSFSLNEVEKRGDSGSITRAMMRALLKTSLVEDVLQELNNLLLHDPDIHISSTDVLAKLCHKLDLPFDDEAATNSDIDQCFICSAGKLPGT
jgi:hypothetical protein